MSNPLEGERFSVAGEVEAALKVGDRARSSEQSALSMFRRRLYLLGAAVQGEMQGFVRGNCIPEELERMDEVLAKWKAARACFRKLEAEEQGVVEQISIIEPAPALAPFLAQVVEDTLFRASFSRHPIEIKRVELDKLVACQRHVDLDYVERLRQQLAGGITAEDAGFCLLPRTPPPVAKQQQLAANACGFSSPNPDFRFLGGFARAVTRDDIEVCWTGGQPVAAIVLLIGYGAPAMNAYQVGRRLILNNGFHRAYALRSAGISEAYLVVQNVGDPQLEFPQNLVGLPREYLLNNPRPALLKDFFNSALVEEFRTTVGVKSIQVAWDANQTMVPI
jgi:hypothetical protein